MCDALIGKTIDNFRLEDVIGQGGMGCVYKAIDERMDRTVALKVIRHKFGVFSAREGKALGQLNHPNIVNVFYMGEFEEGTFITMEYIEGKTLNAYKNSSPEEALSFLKQSLLALEHAHERGIYHRDIKPSNIMVTPRGTVKVMDFGLAKVNTNDANRTVTRFQAGTINYMSPEQVRGLHNVDHRSDIYSLGKAFYEILAGRLPFDTSDSDQFDIWKMIVEVKFKPPSTYNKAIPRGLDRIIMKALEKDPKDRYQNAREMLAAIEKYESKTKSFPSQIPTNGHAPARARKNRGVLIAAAVALLASIVAGGLYAAGFFSSSPPPPPAATSLIIASRPSNAIITVNGISRGRTPSDTVTVNGETVRLQVTQIDYEPLDTTLTLTQGQVNNVHLTLRPAGSTPLQTVETRLSIESSPPGATVIVDGERLGVTPLSEPIPAGPHRLELALSGYQRHVQNLDLEAGNNQDVRVTLRAMGGISVASTPSGAMVRIDGQQISATPLNNHRLAAGAYQIEVTMDGFAQYTQTVQVPAGGVESIDVPLQVLTSTLRVLPMPDGAIYIDGQRVQEELPGWLERELPRGRHTLRVTNSRFGEWEKVIDLNNEEEVYRINFNDVKQANITTGEIRGAAIFVDGVDTGLETLTTIELRVGIRRIEVRKEGYGSAYKDILVESDSPEPIRVVFELEQ